MFGDDSTSEWDAPTNGRFYARVERHDYARSVGQLPDLVDRASSSNQFSRGPVRRRPAVEDRWRHVRFGERRSTTDVPGAEPGTLDSREEFRGTGGSLYYLHRQDITRGSERLWIDVRDETSGITLQRIQLVPGIDYEMSYLQGRIMLRAPPPFCCRWQYARAARQPERQSCVARGELRIFAGAQRCGEQRLRRSPEHVGERQPAARIQRLPTGRCG